jgi:hypothetical protein
LSWFYCGRRSGKKDVTLWDLRKRMIELLADRDEVEFYPKA